MSGSTRLPPPKAVTAKVLRDRFNDDKVWERLASGKLRSEERSRRPGGSQSGQPAGTESVMTEIRTNDGFLVALVHQFERPDGTTTMPDPKTLMVGRELWKLEHKKQEGSKRP